MERPWNPDRRRRKKPSLYDEYLTQERTTSPTANAPGYGSGAMNMSAQDNTIRAVTPDSSSDEPLVEPTSTKAFERDFLALSSSPGSAVGIGGRERSSPRGIPRSATESLLGYNGGSPAGHAIGSRPRTRTLDGRTQDTPRTLMHKHRLRLGSINDVGSAKSSNNAAPSPSVSQPNFASPGANVAAGIERPESSGSTSASSTSGPLPSPNARRILHLMKTLCGRMSGNVAFRRGEQNPWTTAYCYIHEETGSLMSESDVDAGLHRTLIPDLRGSSVKCLIDDITEAPFIDISSSLNGNLSVHLRLLSQSDLESWFAALLCWQPIRPKGVYDRVVKPATALGPPRPPSAADRYKSEASLVKEPPAIKVGKMIYWDTNTSFTANVGTTRAERPQAVRMQSYGTRWWRRVSCTLRENGELKLYTDTENALVSVVQLSQLSRCAIQRLDRSVLEHEFCIAIYPQYASIQSSSPPLRPIFLSLETQILHEVWFVLLRAFTIPQLYGPKPTVNEDADDSDSSQKYEGTAKADMFRMERGLSIRIVEAKIAPNAVSLAPDAGSLARPAHGNKPEGTGGHYVEVHLDGEPRGKTLVKHEGSYPFWREEFEYFDLPAVLSTASVVLKHRPPDFSSARGQHETRLIHEAYGLVKNGQDEGATSGYSGISRDLTLGKVDIFLDELEAQKEVEKWWPVENANGQRVGEMLIRARAEESVILMSRDYEELSQLLHRFDNGLTVQIALSIPSDLKRLSDTLLNIFQATGRVTDWLMALVEDEIDGLSKESPMSRLRYGRRAASNDEDAPVSTRLNSREALVRDMNKNATLEANLLFRGNTLLTKALDTHMRRVGIDYLRAALGQVIISINDRDPECEVDPNRLANPHDLQRNWTRLLATTQEVWLAIRNSESKCPVDLRFIFRHIRACADDRYGDFLRSVSYSSVSGFLFLRFFCPAVLNPKLFGLLDDDPKPRARRTFTLIAKSLQGLANMASFGSKEHWMEPMNAFLSAHREEFKRFVENVCFVPHPPNAMPEVPPSYLTPLAIKNRLPQTSREGFPSLPYLLDEAREYASLVSIWLSSVGTEGGKAYAQAASEYSQRARSGSSASISAEDEAIRRFHIQCTALYARTQECLSRAERAERPNSELSFRWQELVESMQGSGLENAPMLDRQAGGLNINTSIRPVSRDANVSPTTIQASQANAGDQLADDRSPTSPSRRVAQRNWENDPDGGAAGAAASLLSLDRERRNPRSGFVLANTSMSSSLPGGGDLPAAFANQGLGTSTGNKRRSGGRGSVSLDQGRRNSDRDEPGLRQNIVDTGAPSPLIGGGSSNGHSDTGMDSIRQPIITTPRNTSALAYDRRLRSPHTDDGFPSRPVSRLSSRSAHSSSGTRGGDSRQGRSRGSDVEVPILSANASPATKAAAAARAAAIAAGKRPPTARTRSRDQTWKEWAAERERIKEREREAARERKAAREESKRIREAEARAEREREAAEREADKERARAAKKEKEREKEAGGGARLGGMGRRKDGRS